MKASDLFRRITKDLGKDNIEVIENGKVIRRKDDATYKVEQSDV
jgi:hypothetical protein